MIVDILKNRLIVSNSFWLEHRYIDLVDDVKQWFLDNNIDYRYVFILGKYNKQSPCWTRHEIEFIFENEKDEILFKLRWF